MAAKNANPMAIISQGGSAERVRTRKSFPSSASGRPRSQRSTCCVRPVSANNVCVTVRHGQQCISPSRSRSASSLSTWRLDGSPTCSRIDHRTAASNRSSASIVPRSRTPMSVGRRMTLGDTTLTQLAANSRQSALIRYRPPWSDSAGHRRSERGGWIRVDPRERYLAAL
jgi:hypothetical protein